MFGLVAAGGMIESCTLGALAESKGGHGNVAAPTGPNPGPLLVVLSPLRGKSVPRYTASGAHVLHVN
jgi:hypothetical protein